MGPQTLLSDLLCHELKISQTLALVDFFMHATPTTYAKYAPLVFTAAEQGDLLAQRIVQQAADHINAIAQRLLSIDPPRLSLIGGLAHKLQPYLAPEVQQKVTPALAAPEFGSVWFARHNQQKAQRIS